MRGGERVDGEQAERGLAVDEHDVVVVEDRAQHAGQDLLAGDLADELHLGGGQVDVGRQDVEALDHVVCLMTSRMSWPRSMSRL